MEPVIPDPELARFGSVHARTLRRRHAAARDRLGLEVPLEEFATRLHHAVLLATGAAGDEPPPLDRRGVEALLARLSADDVYLAIAAAAGDPAAAATIRRWYGPFLAELGRPAGRDDLDRELLERGEDGS